MRAPLAVIVAADHVISEKSVNATDPSEVGATPVSVAPPAEYAVPEISPAVVYTVVLGPRSALLK
jgi:hypothetical protein